MRAIERSDVALLMIDATDGISAQDAHIAGYILEEWKSVVVVVNKWDAIEKDSFTMNQFTEIIRKDLNFMPYVPILYISVKTGQRVEDVLPTALMVQEERLARISTSSLNEILQKAQDAHSISGKTGKIFKIFYGTQVRSDPPTFLIYCNEPALVHFSYLRFLENRIREVYKFSGTPIHLVFKSRH
jgi:GTP-binding protein